MTFQVGDYVLFDGQICRVRYANHEIVVYWRISDCHTMMSTPRELAAEQVPWVQRSGWWSQMRDVQHS